MTTAFAGVVSSSVSSTACAIWSLLYPTWGSVTRVLLPYVVRCESNGWKLLASISHNKETISIVISLTVMTEGKLGDRSPPVACHDVPHRFVGRGHRRAGRLKPTSGDGGRRWRRCTWSRRAAATATASNGSTSTASRPTGSPRTTTASPRWNRCRWRNGRSVPRPPPTTAPTGARSGGRGCRSAKRRGALRHTDEGERFDDFAIRQEWWTGEALPEAKVVRRELAGVPKIEVVGPVQGEGGGDLLGRGHPGQGRAGRSPEEITSAISCGGWKETGIATRHCRPYPS